MKRLLLLLLLLVISVPVAINFIPAGVPALPPLADRHIVDAHVHAAGLGYGDSGAFISEGMRSNIRFPIFLWAMGVTEDELKEHGDRILFERLSNKIAASQLVDQAVVLALDGFVTDQGVFDEARTQVYMPNDFVARETAGFDNLLFGASINPNRRDAIERLRQAHRDGALLVKWIPSIMNIDPADPRHIPFYETLVELDMPLLSHAGMEKSFAGARDELADPLRLDLPLRHNVKVIAAHIATTGTSEGRDNFERIMPMLRAYPNLYADISSLTQINKLGYLARALRVSGLSEQLIYGTDWPLQFFPMVSPWFHIRHIGLTEAWQLRGIRNQWDRDVALKAAFGVPDAVFTRSARLLKVKPLDEQ